MTAGVGTVVDAEVMRVERYGVYLRSSLGEIVVLIPDVSHEPIPELVAVYSAAERVRVRLVEWVEDRKLFKGTIKDADSRGPERSP